jgi:hypothetical protein
MTHKGIPDGSRAARLILKDYVNGKILYCYPPPGYNSDDFQHYPNRFESHTDADNNDETKNNEHNASTETTSKVYFIHKIYFCLLFIILSHHVFSHRMSINNSLNQ